MTLIEFTNKLHNNPEINYSLCEDVANKEIEIVYYWYHHMMDKDVCNHIQQVIDRHDLRAFGLYSWTLNKDGITYLPSIASVYCDDEFVGEISILSEAAFAMITYSECECG